MIEERSVAENAQQRLIVTASYYLNFDSSIIRLLSPAEGDLISC